MLALNSYGGIKSDMSKARSFQGRAMDGKIVFDMPSKVVEHIKLYPDGTRLSVEVKRFYKKRSLPQNSYLHKVFSIIASHLGYNDYEVKEMMKHMFLLYYDHNDLPFIKSTSKLDTLEFEVFSEQVRRWAAEFDGINIMTPGEYWKSIGVEK